MIQTIPPIDPPVLLITRPRQAALRFARDIGYTPAIISPLTQTLWHHPEEPKCRYDGVVFTSERGIGGWVRQQLPVPDMCYCVGQRTADVAMAQGFRAVSADGDLAKLSQMLQNRAAGKTLLHARGLHVSGDLTALDVRIIPYILYEQQEIRLSQKARDALAHPRRVIAPLFSVRTARIFARQLKGLDVVGLEILCMSPAIADAAADAGLVVGHIAKTPTAAAMQTLFAAVNPP